MARVKVSHPTGMQEETNRECGILDIPYGCEQVIRPPREWAFFYMGRAGGDVECETCGKKLYDHPTFRYMPELTLGCGARLYKL